MQITARRASPTRTATICRQCRRSFVPTGANQRYCQTCRPIVDLESHQRNWEARIPRVSTTQLRLFRQDPQREKKLSISDFVVCRVCGAKREMLAIGARFHLHLHGITVAKYHKRWPGAPLNCPAVTERRRTSHTGKSHRNYRIGRDDERTLRPWLIVPGIAQGQTSNEIAKSLGRTRSDITARARRLGISGHPAFRDFGQPVSRATVVQLKSASGLRNELFLKQFPNNRSWLRNSMSGSHAADRHVRPDAAQMVITWRDETLRRLARSKPDRRAYNMASVLRTFLPNLRESTTLLVAVLETIQIFFYRNPAAQIDEWQDWLCDQATHEAAGRIKGTNFRSFLLWAPEVSPFLARRIQHLRGRRRRPRSIALEFLTARWQSPGAIRRTAPTVSVPIIEEALRARTRPVPPEKMAWLILSASRKEPVSASHQQQPALAPVQLAAASADIHAAKRGPGRQHGKKGKDTDRQITLAAALLYIGEYSQPKMVPHLYPLQNDKEAGRKAVQKFLKRNSRAIEREKVGMTPDRANATIQSGFG
jgi:hypothetical protein